jgi:hypothetical protein
MFACLSARLLIVVVRCDPPGRPGPDPPNAAIERDGTQSFVERFRPNSTLAAAGRALRRRVTKRERSVWSPIRSPIGRSEQPRWGFLICTKPNVRGRLVNFQSRNRLRFAAVEESSGAIVVSALSNSDKEIRRHFLMLTRSDERRPVFGSWCCPAKPRRSVPLLSVPRFCACADNHTDLLDRCPERFFENNWVGDMPPIKTYEIRHWGIQYFLHGWRAAFFTRGSYVAWQSGI